MAVIVSAPEEAEEQSPVSAEVQARLRGGKKRAKKLKQRMAARYSTCRCQYRAPVLNGGIKHGERGGKDSVF